MQLRNALVSLGSFVFIGALIACSSSSDSSSSGSGAVTCPKVGDKACPNDPAATQAVVDLCNKCSGQASTLAKCQGSSSSAGAASCDASGKSSSSSTSSTQVKDECKQAFSEYFACVLGGSGLTLDAGAGG